MYASDPEFLPLVYSSRAGIRQETRSFHLVAASFLRLLVDVVSRYLLQLVTLIQRYRTARHLKAHVQLFQLALKEYRYLLREEDAVGLAIMLWNSPSPVSRPAAQTRELFYIMRNAGKKGECANAFKNLNSFLPNATVRRGSTKARIRLPIGFARPVYGRLRQCLRWSSNSLTSFTHCSRRCLQRLLDMVCLSTLGRRTLSHVSLS